MPRYLRVADVPAILTELRDEGSSKPPYQLDAWQHKWCEFTSQPEEDAAVLSYRWRIRGHSENVKDYKTWVTDCGKEGYAVHELRDGPTAVDWSLADGHALQIEVAAWLLWVHSHGAAKYAWVDQMCVPQDADLEEKMGHIKDSPAIYRTGKVYLLIAPVVDYISGRIMNAQDARAIVKQYNGEMDSYRGARFLSRSAVKALLVNHSYMRRVWTIQEAVAAQDLTVWPLKGKGEVNSYQSIYVVDWPEFNAWNSHPDLGPLYLKFGDEALNDYYEGDYTGVIRVLRERRSDAIAYLAMISKDLMWITMDRNGLVNDVKRADTPARRAFVVLNNHQIQSARAFLPEDRVLALVPLVDYQAWKEATAGVPGRQLVQASVAWAYGIMEREMATWKWSIRIYNSPTCTARGLELLQPRRNLGNTSAMTGAAPCWELQIPPEGGTLTLRPECAHPDPGVTAYLAATSALYGTSPRELRVLAALLMPHPGQAKYWGGGPWTHIRDALQTDEVFRLSVQWGLEAWRDPALGVDAERSVVVVVSGGGLLHPAMIILALAAGEEQPATAQVMEVVDVSSPLLPALLEGLRANALGALTRPLTAVSAGVVPPPPAPECEPSAADPDWQLVSVPAAAEEEVEEGKEVPAPPAEPDPMDQGDAAGAASASRPSSARPPSAAVKTPSRPPSARPGSAAVKTPSRPPSAAVKTPSRSPSARPTTPTAAAEVVPSGDSTLPAGAAMHKGGEGALPDSGVEVAAGAKYAGRAPVAQGDEGPCKGCVVS